MTGYNETKYKILYLISNTLVDMSPQEIATAIGISKHNAMEQMHRLNDMGYVYRRKETRTGRRNYYAYCNLKSKGRRVLKQLRKRVQLREDTGREISLNLKKPVPRR